MGIWYSYSGGEYKGNCPPYYDLDGTPWYNKLQDQLAAIQEDTVDLMKNGEIGLQPYFNKTLVKGNKWTSATFMAWGSRNKKMIKKGEKIFAHFRDIPGLVSLSVSVLQPCTEIKPHYGDTDAIYRMHIPIFIPGALPECGLKVGGVTKAWKNDEIIAFCDAHYHEAWNKTSAERVILIVDVVKPEYLSISNKICTNVLTYLKFQYIAGRFTFISKLPLVAKYFIGGILRILPDVRI